MYFVIYDLNDDLIAYFDNIEELLNYVSLRKYDINYKFNHTDKDYILVNQDSIFLKIYRFEE